MTPFRTASISTVAVALIIAVAGCSNGAAANSSLPLDSSVAGAGNSVSAAALAVQPATFVRQVQQGATGVTSVSGTVAFNAQGVGEDGTFEEKIASNTVTAIDMQVTLKEQGQNIAVEVRFVAGKLYIGGPDLKSADLPTDKPWVQASTTSSDERLREFATAMTSVSSLASSKQFLATAKAASTVTRVGTTVLGGVSATEFHVTIDLAKLQTDLPGGLTAADLKAADGNKPPSAEMWLDNQNRPVQMVQNLTVSSNPATFKMTFDSYNRPVTITAPPAADTYTG